MKAFILGGAACVWDDLSALKALTDLSDWTCFCINDAGWAYRGHMHHWVTVHPEKLAAWKAIREREQPDANRRYLVWSTRPHKLVDIQVSDSWGGGSGLTTIRAARTQLDRIVCCGMPMDEMEHFDRPGTFPCEKYRAAFLNKATDLAPFVRSMSGWTAELFGRPDPAWLGIERKAA